MSKKVLWWIGLVIAILTAVVSYCSCSVLAVTAGKARSSVTTSTVTTLSVDSNQIINPFNLNK